MAKPQHSLVFTNSFVSVDGPEWRFSGHMAHKIPMMEGLGVAFFFSVLLLSSWLAVLLPRAVSPTGNFPGCCDQAGTSASKTIPLGRPGSLSQHTSPFKSEHVSGKMCNKRNSSIDGAHLEKEMISFVCTTTC